jgi:hypothetical protein
LRWPVSALDALVWNGSGIAGGGDERFRPTLLVLKAAEAGTMWIIFLVAVVGYSFWLWVIGLVWLTLLILPYLILCGLFFYFFRRELRRRTEMRAMLERQVDRQRQLNAQEHAAWTSTADDRQRPSRRDKALERFDRRNPRP